MRYNLRFVSSYPERVCGIATYCRDLATALSHCSEVDSIRIAAIDEDYKQIPGNPERFTTTPYFLPVDMTIDRNNEGSWIAAAGEIITRAAKSDYPTVIIMQHEFGLAGRSDYQNMAKIFRANDKLTTLVNMHTAVRNPNEDQRAIVKEISDLTEGIIVPTEAAVNILTSDSYGLPREKVKQIKHGIRVHEYSQLDGDETKRRLGIRNLIPIVNIGLRSPSKGTRFIVESYGKFIQDNSLSDELREMLCLFVFGDYHPKTPQEIKKADEEEIKAVMKDYGLKSTTVREFNKIGRAAKNSDVVFYQKPLTEAELREGYTIGEICVIGNREPQQISSGILSDAAGFGKVIVSTKNIHSLELLCPPELRDQSGLVGKFQNSPGLLVDIEGDKNIPSIDQYVEAFKYLLIEDDSLNNPKANLRRAVGEKAREIAHEMRWEYIGRIWAENISSILDMKFAPKSTPVILEESVDAK
jgi:hypothetical protein